MAMAAVRREGRRCFSPIAALRSSLIAEDSLLNYKSVILGDKAKAQTIRDSKNDIPLQKNPLNYAQVVEMALLGKVGNILRQTATKKISSEVSPLKLSNYEAMRCMSSMPHSKLFIGGIPSQTDEQALNAKELLGCRVRMNDAIYRRRFGDIGGSDSGSYGVRHYSGGGGVTAGGVASYGSNTALANVAELAVMTLLAALVLTIWVVISVEGPGRVMHRKELSGDGGDAEFDIRKMSI